MINTIIIEPEPQALTLLQKNINRYCPYLKVAASLECLSNAHQLIAQLYPELIFLNPQLGKKRINELKLPLLRYSEIIFLSSFEKGCFELIKHKNCAFILKPIQPLDFILAVNHALNRIVENKKRRQQERHTNYSANAPTKGEIIAIPTIDGYEFLPVNQIIRCEGLQKCTRLVLVNQSSMVSSYNLGEFVRLLEPYGFISTHRSHLINLKKMVRYHKEGTITMSDGAYIPVSRRRKEAFLNAIVRV